MKPRSQCGLFIFLLFLAVSKADEPHAIPDGQSGPTEPNIPSFALRITDFGALGDGHSINTVAFEAAIQAVAAHGGGRVVVPPGLWLTGPIVLRNRVDLHLQRGALVQFSDHREDYPLVETSYEGRSGWRCQSPISGRHLEHIAITGEGVFDGAGQVWRPVKKSKMTDRQWADLVASGGVVNERGDMWYPSPGSLRGNEGFSWRAGAGRNPLETIKDSLRPVLLKLVDCRNVLLEGVTFQNSPAWCLHPLMCEELTIRRVTVRNPWYSQNGDGLDIESCRNVLVEGCSFDVGDDAICLKSGRDAAGRRRGRPTEDVIVRDCVVYHGHGGFVIGSEMSGGVRNVHIADCIFMGTDVGLRFKSTRGRGGVVEAIHIERILLTDIPTDAIRFNLYYGGEAPTDKDAATAGNADIPPVTEETPAFRNIVLRNIVCRGAQRAALLRGLPEMPLENVQLQNLNISAEEGILARDVNRLRLSGISLDIQKGSPLVLHDARAVDVRDWDTRGSPGEPVQVAGQRTGPVHLPAWPPGRIKVDPEVPDGAVTFE